MIQPMIRKNRSIWEGEYSHNTPIRASEVPRSSLSTFISNLIASEASQMDDDFDDYINGHGSAWTEWNSQNLFHWWDTCQYPGLRQWALDTLSIPAMSAELER